MCLMTILKDTKNQGFTLALEDAFFENQKKGGGGWGQTEPPPAVLGLRNPPDCLPFQVSSCVFPFAKEVLLF